MTTFNNFRDAINKNFEKMSNHNLYVVDVNVDELWELYLDSYPEGTNPIHKERRVHDCNTCKSFIRKLGAVVQIVGEELISIWDCEGLGDEYKVVAEKLASYVKSHKVSNRFLSEIKFKKVGCETSWDAKNLNSYEHFYATVPEKHLRGDSLGRELSDFRSGFDVTIRGLREITLDAIETVLGLISDNNLYRGSEHLRTVETFKKLKTKFDALETEEQKELFGWENTLRIRNTSIGTLLVDLSEGECVEKAVKKFEAKVAPENYKRPKSIVTAKMVAAAKEKVSELGLLSALPRRYATQSDIRISEILHANREVKPNMKPDAFDILTKSVTKPKTGKKKDLEKAEVMTITTFIEDVLPDTESVEVLLENKHTKNLVSLLAPEDEEANQLFQWDNGFSWDYAGGLADSSIAKRVKEAGGNIDAPVRVSLSWFNSDDLDLHVTTPVSHVYFGNKKCGKTGGELDVDMNASSISIDPVENIYWEDEKRLIAGEYIIKVHNYTKRGNTSPGFEVEIAINGEISKLSYELSPRVNGSITVGKLIVSADGKITIQADKKLTTSSKKVWGVDTGGFQEVEMLMKSPNYWGENKEGNLHYFFMLKDCKRDESARGFYNEFLNKKLNPHRKVLEVLGSTIKIEDSEEQLSGVGFSTTRKEEIICRVKGKYNGVLKLQINE